MPDTGNVTDQWALIDSQGEVRVLLTTETRARRLCDRYHHIGMDRGPFRVAHVYVVEALT